MPESKSPKLDASLSRRDAVKTMGGLGLFGLLGRFGTYAESARGATRAALEIANANYVFPRAPLAKVPYARLPLGAVKPKGWLREQLQRMAGGMAGYLDELYRAVGPTNAWKGGRGDNWERGPYWLDGLVPLAYTLGNQRLIDKAQEWIEWTLQSQQPSGYFGPPAGKDYREDPPGKDRRFFQTDKPADWWPHMVMLKALRSYHEATGDERVLPFMTRYFRYQQETLPEKPLNHWSPWGKTRGGENQSSIYWLYNRTGEDFLLDLAPLVFEQTADWTNGFLAGDLPSRHVVNVAMAVKQPALQYLHTKDETYLRAVERGLTFLMTEHGQPQGMFSGDELLHGTDPTRGTEACAVVELMYSLETLARITGSVGYLDHLERVAYNALPTQHTDDYRGRQYFQQPNQIRISRGHHRFVTPHHGVNLCYGLTTGYPCCTTNMHQGWPKFTRHLWLATSGGGLAALQYASSEVEAKVAGGTEVRFTEETTYPFSSEIRFHFESEEAVRFPLHLRVPGWTEGTATIRVNGRTESRPEAGQIARVDRRWQRGDEVTLELPMSIRTSRWHERSAAIERGPLVYALPVEGDWQQLSEEEFTPAWTTGYEVPTFEVHPKAPWNYGIRFRARTPQESFEVVEDDEMPEYPWTAEAVPVRLRGQGKRIPFWNEYNGMSGPLPHSPVRRVNWEQASLEDMPVEEVTLLPYGATTLRIAEFPVLRD